MASSITLAGESLKAQKQGAHEVLEIRNFVLALVPGLDPNNPIDRSAGLPPAEQIVGTWPYTQKGFVDPNRVVYSLMLGSDIGDFDWNWIGLTTAEGTLFAVSTVPVQQKRRNIPPLQAGNNVTRNFLVAFDGAQEMTGITVAAATWMHDFTAALANKQPLDATLTALAKLVTSNNQLIYSTGADTFAMTPLTEFIRTLLDDTDATGARQTLELGTAATADLTQSQIDRTAGRALKVADFGVGADFTTGLPFASDLSGSQISASGAYRYNTISVGKPTFGSGYGELIQLSAVSDGTYNYGGQIALDYDADAIGFRRLGGETGWSPWRELYHTGNISTASVKQAQTAGHATTADSAGNAIGVSQQYANVTASRTPNVTYTNTTGRTIHVIASINAGNGVSVDAHVNGLLVARRQYSGDNYYNATFPIDFLVPPNATYSINSSNIPSMIWIELHEA